MSDDRQRRIAELYAAADTARTAGRAADVERHHRSVLALDPRQPRALNTLGLMALERGQATDAVLLLQRATAADPRAVELWLNLASAQRAAGKDAGELESLNGALAVDPYQVVALIQRAQLSERLGSRRDAARDYKAVVAIVGNAVLPAAMASAIEHGRRVVADEQRALGETLESHLRNTRTAVVSPRFEHCVDALVGRRQIYLSTPTELTYPGLPAIEFFETAAFPWLAALEAATPVVQREFAGLLRDAEGDFSPYVDVPSGAPVNQWASLNRSRDWSALFLWKDGVRNAANCARCPETAALLGSLPLLDMPGRGPAAFFSVLRAGAHIPPHVGVTNIRAVVHLPLVVPPECGLRVGSQTRRWEIGTALAFDDTIEHEAWNRSGEARAVLIVDAWNPGLDDHERALLRALTIGLDVHAQAAPAR